MCHTVPSAGIIRIRSSGRIIAKTPLSQVVPGSRITLYKIGYLGEVCNYSGKDLFFMKELISIRGEYGGGQVGGYILL